MYRCAGCDSPAGTGHFVACPAAADDMEQRRQEFYRSVNTRPSNYGDEYRINIASGEDVQLEETVCS